MQRGSNSKKLLFFINSFEIVLKYTTLKRILELYLTRYRALEHPVITGKKMVIKSYFLPFSDSTGANIGILNM